MNIIDFLASIAGIMLSAGYYPQAYAIWKKKSAADVSKLSYWVFGFGTTIWMFYGIYMKNWPIFLGFVFGVIGSWLVLILSYIYDK